jgi:hypothetical protein
MCRIQRPQRVREALCLLRRGLTISLPGTSGIFFFFFFSVEFDIVDQGGPNSNRNL